MYRLESQCYCIFLFLTDVIQKASNFFIVPIIFTINSFHCLTMFVFKIVYYNFYSAYAIKSFVVYNYFLNLNIIKLCLLSYISVLCVVFIISFNLFLTRELRKTNISYHPMTEFHYFSIIHLFLCLNTICNLLNKCFK